MTAFEPEREHSGFELIQYDRDSYAGPHADATAPRTVITFDAILPGRHWIACVPGTSKRYDVT